MDYLCCSLLQPFLWRNTGIVCDPTSSLITGELGCFQLVLIAGSQQYVKMLGFIS